MGASMDRAVLTVEPRISNAGGTMRLEIRQDAGYPNTYEDIEPPGTT